MNSPVQLHSCRTPACKNHLKETFSLNGFCNIFLPIYSADLRVPLSAERRHLMNLNWFVNWGNFVVHVTSWTRMNLRFPDSCPSLVHIPIFICVLLVNATFSDQYLGRLFNCMYKQTTSQQTIPENMGDTGNPSVHAHIYLLSLSLLLPSLFSQAIRMLPAVC